MHLSEEQKIACAKALANCLHREIIEEAHADYKISQSDMEAMNRQAVNRAKVIVDFLDDELDFKVFSFLYSFPVKSEWDDPVETEETKKMRELIRQAKTGCLFK